MGQVAAVRQAHAQHGIAGLEQRQIDRCVGLTAGVWLNVGVVGTKQLSGAVDGQLLDLVDVLATAVVTLAGIALCVLVGQTAALRLHHAFAGVVLRGDQLDMVFLTLLLGVHRRQQCIVITLDLVLLAEHRGSPSGGAAPDLSFGRNRAL